MKDQFEVEPVTRISKVVTRVLIFRRMQSTRVFIFKVIHIEA